MLYLYDSNDKFIQTLSESDGIRKAKLKDYVNKIKSNGFSFTVDIYSDALYMLIEDRQIAVKDMQGDFRLYRIKSIEEEYAVDGGVTIHCDPAYFELADHFIEDRRIRKGTFKEALTKVLEGTRYTPEYTKSQIAPVDISFYWMNGLDGVERVLQVGGGYFKEVVRIDNLTNAITTRKIVIQNTLSRETGVILDTDYNAERIVRHSNSYVSTALWGQGASLEIEGEDGEPTGGHSRYITFEDVVWSKAKGDPVDKPKGQKWVGLEDLRQEIGYLTKDGKRLHRFGHFSNQDYEEPADLLRATYEALIEMAKPEVSYEATIHNIQDILAGDIVTILDRNYAKPVTLQAGISGVEYDPLLENKDVSITIGEVVDFSRDPLEDKVKELETVIDNNRPKWESKPDVEIDINAFPNDKPATPTIIATIGGMSQVYVGWEYDSAIYISHYELHASKSKDFTPSTFTMVWEGKGTAYSHYVEPDEVWWYKVVAVNYHGKESDPSEQKSGTAKKISFEYFDEETKGKLSEISTKADDAISKAQESFDKANEALDVADSKPSKEDLDKMSQSLSEKIDIVDKAKADLKEFEELKKDYEVTEGEVSKVTTDISNIKGELSTKVDQTDYNADKDGILTSIDKHSTQITQNSKELESKASKTEVDGLSQKVDRAETSIKQNAEEIASKASKSEVDDLEGRVKSAESSIVQNAEEIKSKVSSSELSDALMSTYIEYQTNDYKTLKDTKEGFKSFTSKQYMTNNIKEVVSIPEIDSEHNIIKFNNYGTFTSPIVRANKGSKYYAGLDLYYEDTTDGTVYLQLIFLDEDKRPLEPNSLALNIVRAEVVEEANKWQRFEGTIVFPDNDSLRNKAHYVGVRYLLGYSQRVGTGYVRDVSFKVLGNEGMSNLESSVTQNAEEIKSKVGKTEFDATTGEITQSISEVSQKADGIAQRVSNTEGEVATLTQTAKGLQSRVEDAEGNINTVTQTAEANQKKIQDVDGNLSKVSQTVDGLSSEIITKADKSTVEQLSDRVSTEVSKLKGDIDGITVGDRNIVLDSYREEITTSENYFITKYDLAIDWQEGEEWSILIKGELNEGQRFGIWSNGSSTNQGYLSNLGTGYHVLTFKVKEPKVVGTNAGEKVLNIYNYPSATSEEASIEWVKMVRGNKFSRDWTPAPEDLATNEDLTNQVESLTSSITQTAENILTEVNRDYVAQDEFSEYQGSISTQFEQTESSFQFSFTNLMQAITVLDGETQREFENIFKYIRFEDGDIILGQLGNEITLRIQHNRLQFLQNGQEVAYFSNNKLYVTDGEFLNSLQVGNFAYLPRANGSLDFRLIRQGER